MIDALLLESGDRLLLENGSFALLESSSNILVPVFLYSGESNPADVELRGAGPTQYVYAGSGGFTLGSSAPVATTRVPALSGGLAYAGTATVQKLKVFSPSGGLALAGAAPLATTVVYLVSGGVVLSGTAATQNFRVTVYSYVGSGGFSLGGAHAEAEVDSAPSGGGTSLYRKPKRWSDEALVPIRPEIVRGPDDIMGNRRRREDYNEYQKHYMRKRRA